MRKRYEVTIVIRGDLDMVPGAYSKVEDWINLVIGPNSDFIRQSHYHTSAEVVEIKEEV